MNNLQPVDNFQTAQESITISHSQPMRVLYKTSQEKTVHTLFITSFNFNSFGPLMSSFTLEGQDTPQQHV